MANMSIADDRRWSAMVETLGFLRSGERPCCAANRSARFSRAALPPQRALIFGSTSGLMRSIATLRRPALLGLPGTQQSETQIEDASAWIHDPLHRGPAGIFLGALLWKWRRIGIGIGGREAWLLGS